ncbi:MAG: bifunctional diaminohydroxyphosphoribosylaminopyrimidine deaminase/5-amino-6-(5-phosphoribosylamino)uracil reductase RibD [Gaiellales bacterium]
MALTETDVRHLERCFELAERGRRTAAPNPVVGAVLVRDGRVLGEGWHERPGEPHAEVNALRAAGDARDATMYVSLEPCAHHGRTPPCADALVEAGVARVVAAMGDPTPSVGGRGFARLREAGIDVELAGGDVELRALRMVAEWLTFAMWGRPHVTYKAAVSADGRTSRGDGRQVWISSPQSRRMVHELRARAGAVAVGIGTVLADDPLLTARDCDPPAERQPLRIVFDRRGRLPADSQLARTASSDAPVLVVQAPGAVPPPPGVDAIQVDGLAPAMATLGRRRISSVLLEGGPTLATGFLDSGHLDRLIVFRSPDELGAGPGLFDREIALPGRPWKAVQVGVDMLTVTELEEETRVHGYRDGIG